MGIALFHLLPESSESFEHYFTKSDPESQWKRLPTAFFIAFISYSLILLFEKVAFDSHSITEHDHGGHAHGEHHSHEDNNSELSKPLLKAEIEKDDDESHFNTNMVYEPTDKHEEIIKGEYIPPIVQEPNREEEVQTRNRGRTTGSNVIELAPQVSPVKKLIESPNIKKNSFYNKKSSSFKLSLDEELLKHNKKEKGYEEEDEEGSSFEDEDRDEQTMKNVVSSKGKFASYMQSRNICEKLLKLI